MNRLLRGRVARWRSVVCVGLIVSALTACTDEGQQFPEGSMEMLHAEWPAPASFPSAGSAVTPTPVLDVFDDARVLEEGEEEEENDANAIDLDGREFARLDAGTRRSLRRTVDAMLRPPVVPTPGVPAPPPPTPTVLPVLAAGGPDPMIAVGKDHIVAIDGGSIWFLDKNGPNAGKALPPKGNVTKTVFSASEFFSQLWMPFKADGSPNPSSVNRHLGLPDDPDWKCNPDTDVVTTKPDGTSEPIKGVCINDFYDNKVVYDAQTSRFVITSAARNNLWDKLGPEDDAVGCRPPADGEDDDLFTRCQIFPRRNIALSVSKTDDPRDGFHQWIITDSNYSDGHVAAVANGYLLITANGRKPQVGVSQGEPLLYAIEMADLANGAVKPRNNAYSKLHFADAVSLRPAHQVGDSDGFAYLLARPSNDIHGSAAAVTQYVYALPKRTTKSFPTPIEMKVDLDLPLGLASHNLSMYADGLLFNAYHFPTPNMRLVRIPVTVSGGTPSVSNNAAKGFLDVAVDDTAGGGSLTAASPAIGVTAAGDAGVIYRVTYSAAHKVIVRRVDREAAAFGLPITIVEGTTAEPMRADFASGAADPVAPNRLWFAHRSNPTLGTGIVMAYLDL